MQQAQVTADSSTAVDGLFARFGAQCFDVQPTPDNTPTLWVERERLLEVLQHLRPQHPMLLDLFGIDERLREHRPQAARDFTVVYHLLNLQAREEIRIKVAVSNDDASVPTASAVWPNADWYERETWDMYGVEFSGHPNLRRILMGPRVDMNRGC